jgi:hypothetical protein
MLLHTGWYVYPFVAPAVWLAYRALQRRLRWSPARRTALALAAGIACVAAQRLVPPPWVSGVANSERLRLDAEELTALYVLHEATPRDAVVMSNRYAGLYAFPLTGIGGRAAYVEGGSNMVYTQTIALDPLSDRFRILLMLWGIERPDSFCLHLRRTPATHLLEHATKSLRVRSPDCLRRLWRGPTGKVTVWEIVR